MSKNIKRALTLSTFESQKAGRYLFLCCFLSYIPVYLARYNLTAALPSITDAQTGIFTADKAGLFGTALLVAYGLGQFINGFIAEKFPPFGLIGFSMLLSAFSNLAMYLSVTVIPPSFGIMITLWAINGYSQSFIWPAFMRTLAVLLPENQRIAAGTNMMMSSTGGIVTANLVSSLVLYVTDAWQPLFLTASIVLFVTAVLWLLATKPLKKDAYTYIEVSMTDKAEKSKKNIGAAPLFPLLISSGVIIALLTSITFPLIKEGLQSWIPTMVKETYNRSPSFAVALSTVMPIISITGAGLARFMMQKLCRDEMSTSVFLMAFTAVVLAAAGAFTLNSLWVTIAMLSIVFTLMIGANTIFVVLIPQRFAKYGRVASVTGITNAVCAAGGGFSSYLTGLFKMSFGWEITLYILAGLALIGCAASLIAVRHWRKFRDM